LRFSRRWLWRMSSSGIKNPVRTSQQTHYVSVIDLSRLMLCKIWGFHGNDYEECRLLGCKNPVRTSEETHYVSPTEPSRLMLCKIWGFHGVDYEECRPLGYKNPVRTSQETHYFSVTELSQLMLCTIWVPHSGDYEECRLLGCVAACLSSSTSQKTAFFPLVSSRTSAEKGNRLNDERSSGIPQFFQTIQRRVP
jgi:hypothetical protein